MEEMETGVILKMHEFHLREFHLRKLKKREGMLMAGTSFVQLNGEGFYYRHILGLATLQIVPFPNVKEGALVRRKKTAYC
jgi:hypothetical protein